MSNPTKGLLLTLGGAPNTPHVIDPLPGFYSPTEPHPVGTEADDLTLEQATQAVEDYPDLLELVDVTPEEAEKAREAQVEQKAASKTAVAKASREVRKAQQDGNAHEDTGRITDELNATKEA